MKRLAASVITVILFLYGCDIFEEPDTAYITESTDENNLYTDVINDSPAPAAEPWMAEPNTEYIPPASPGEIDAGDGIAYYVSAGGRPVDVRWLAGMTLEELGQYGIGREAFMEAADMIRDDASCFAWLKILEWRAEHDEEEYRAAAEEYLRDKIALTSEVVVGNYEKFSEKPAGFSLTDARADNFRYIGEILDYEVFSLSQRYRLSDPETECVLWENDGGWLKYDTGRSYVFVRDGIVYGGMQYDLEPLDGLTGGFSDDFIAFFRRWLVNSKGDGIISESGRPELSLSFTGGNSLSLTEKSGLTLILPESWRDRLYLKKYSDHSVAVCIDELRDSGMDGTLFYLVKYDELMTYDEFQDSELTFAGNRYIASAADGTYVLYYASDLQFPPDYEDEYRALEEGIKDIRFRLTIG